MCAPTDVLVHLGGLFAAGGGGGAAGGGQGGGAGLRWTLLTGLGHLVQPVLSGRVGLHAAGGRRVLHPEHKSLVNKRLIHLLPPSKRCLLICEDYANTPTPITMMCCGRVGQDPRRNPLNWDVTQDYGRSHELYFVL